MSSRKGLSRFGVSPPTPVRNPARDNDDLTVCPECGAPVGKSKSAHRIEHPTVLEDEIDDAIGDDLVTFGWKCDRHNPAVVLPMHAGGIGSPAMRDGWSSVRVEIAGAPDRHIPVPEPELPDGYEPHPDTRGGSA